MRKVLKWIGIVLAGLVGLLIIVVVVATIRANRLMTQKWEFTPDTVQIPGDAESVARGQYLVEHLMLCQDCHGPVLGGQEFFTEADGAGTLWAPNLTSGKGGIGGTYTDADWLRALRHGIRPNGENLIIMPAEFYTNVGGEDIADVIAYLKTLPPVDRQIPPRSLAFVPKLMLGLGVIPAADFFPPQKIDHSAAPRSVPARGVTAEYGGYLALVCTACHGENLAGMPADPGSGSAATPSLTPGGNLGGWSEAEFIHTMQTGVTPDGRQLDPMQMPWQRLGGLAEEDLQAIWLYLQSVPATPATN